MTTVQPPPEGQLLRRAREALDLTPEEAALKTGIRLGERRWRQIEDGTVVKGEPTRATDKTLAHMAAAVSLTPDQLTAVDRGEAAEILREILRLRAASRPAQPEELRTYPDVVGDDPFFQHIWCFDDAPEADRIAAIHGVRVYREVSVGMERTPQRRRA